MINDRRRQAADEEDRGEKSFQVVFDLLNCIVLLASGRVQSRVS